MLWPKRREIRIAARHRISVIGEPGDVPSVGPAIVVRPVLGGMAGVRFVAYINGIERAHVYAITTRHSFVDWRIRRIAFRNIVRYLRHAN